MFLTLRRVRRKATRRHTTTDSSNKRGSVLRNQPRGPSTEPSNLLDQGLGDHQHCLGEMNMRHQNLGEGNHGVGHRGNNEDGKANIYQKHSHCPEMYHPRQKNYLLNSKTAKNGTGTFLKIIPQNAPKRYRYLQIHSAGIASACLSESFSRVVEDSECATVLFQTDTDNVETSNYFSGQAVVLRK